MIKKIGFGGGCHWCTEAVFASLKGVKEAAQGWIASSFPNDAFSEAVVVSYDDEMISLADLIDIHLHTHSSASLHSMRDKYRSAIYYFDDEDIGKTSEIIESLQSNFQATIITQVLPYVCFKASLPQHLNYYYSNPEKPFCTLYINPKIQVLKEKFAMLTIA